MIFQAVFCTIRNTKFFHLAEAALPTQGTPWDGTLLEPCGPLHVGEAASGVRLLGSVRLPSHLMHNPHWCRLESVLHTFRTQGRNFPSLETRTMTGRIFQRLGVFGRKDMYDYTYSYLQLTLLSSNKVTAS